jgi:hypothetical protein
MHRKLSINGVKLYAVASAPLYLVRLSHCRGEKIRCNSLPNLEEEVKFTEHHLVRN